MAQTKRRGRPAGAKAKTATKAKTAGKTKAAAPAGNEITAKDVSKDLKKLLTAEFQMLGAELKAKQKRYAMLADILGKEI
jgi:hypothetical protein